MKDVESKPSQHERAKQQVNSGGGRNRSRFGDDRKVKDGIAEEQEEKKKAPNTRQRGGPQICVV